MKKAHILKKKEARLLERMGPVTEDNLYDYPIGNPFKKISKAEMKEVRKVITEHRNNQTPEQKAALETLAEKYRKEDENLILREKRKQVRRLFFKN